MKSDLLKLFMIISKHTLYVFFMMCLGQSFLFAAESTGQSIHDVYISLNVNDVRVEEGLRSIEDKTNFTFAYGDDVKTLETKVDLVYSRATVATILRAITKSTGIEFHQINGTISAKINHDYEAYLERRNHLKDLQPDLSNKIIRGRVVGESGDPLPGANVLVRGTSIGAVTDVDGNYSLSVPDDAEKLVCSFIGYDTQEIEIGNSTVIDFVMVMDITSLQEVIVSTGYWETREKESTGNIEKVTAKTIEKQPVPNVLQALQGRMAGVEIVQQSGVQGAAMKLQIRGQNSLRIDGSDNGNLPLYVIDGVPVVSGPIPSYGDYFSITGIDPLSTISPANIESVEILKDADATSIYGSRGANGVVLITTKSGRSGKLGLDVDVYTGVGQVSNMLDLMNTEEYLEMRFEAYDNDAATPRSSAYDVNGTWDQDRYTDWQEVLFGGTANISNVQAAISGGNSLTSFRLGGSFHKETTVFPGDFSFKQGSGQFNLNHSTADKRFNLNLTMNYGLSKNDLYNGGSVTAALALAPNAPELYDEDGNLNWENSTWSNPLAGLLNKHEVNSYNLITNTVASYELLPGLKIRANLGYNSLANDEKILNPLSANLPLYRPFLTSYSTFGNSTTRTWIAEPQIAFTKDIASSKLDVMLGTTWQGSASTSSGIRASGFVSEALIENVGAADDVQVFDNTRTEYRYNALFGRIRYNLNGKYILNLTGRRDGSSRFGPDKKFANFGAVGAAWIFSNENFVTSALPFLSFGKLRTSYGTTGSDQIGDYGYLDTYQAINTTYLRGPGGLVPTQLTNSDFAWEINKKFEAGIDVGLFDDRVNLDGTWYRNRSSNQLVGYPLPSTTGFSTVQYNLPATVQNTGWEFGLSLRILQKEDFSWNLASNLTIPRNKLVDYPNIEGSSYANTYIVGEPLTIVKLYQVNGVDPQTGLFDVVDVNEDGRYNFDDRILFRDLGRKSFGGVQNTLKYKGFELDFFVEFVNQDGRNYISLFSSAPGYSRNQLRLVMDRWQEAGDVTTIQRYTQSSSSSSGYRRAIDSSFGIEDASFVRLKTLSLTWNLPEDFIHKVGLRSMRIYVQGQNLFTLTDYTGLDPQNPGVANIPALKVISGGLQIKL